MEWGGSGGEDEEKPAIAPDRKTVISFQNIPVNMAGPMKMRKFTFKPL